MNRVEKAQKIALLKSNKKYYKDLIEISRIVEKYSTFNGLMEVFEDINNNKDLFSYIEIQYRNVYAFLYRDEYKEFPHNSKTPLLDALQDAIIYLLEYKEKEK